MVRFLFIFALIVTVPFLSCRSSRSNSNDREPGSLFWKVSGNGLQSPTYILGTIHILCKEDIVFSDVMKKALAGSDEVYFELDMDDPSVSLSMLGSMKMSKGKTMKDLYSEADYRRLEKFCKDSLSLNIASMNQFKPFFLVSSIYPKLMPCKSISGVDQEVMKLAMSAKKPIKGLETVEFQASFFDSIPYEVQAKELLNFVDSFQTYRNYMARMSADYRSRNLNALKEMMEKTDVSYSGMQEMMVDNRNRNWVKQLQVIMHEKNIFLAVGAGHLPGPNGLIQLLRKKGYSVEPVKE